MSAKADPRFALDRRRAVAVLCSAAAVAGLAACGQAPRRMQVVQGVRFELSAIPSRLHPQSMNTYQIGLDLFDTASSARIQGAKVWVNVLGLGHPLGSPVITMLPGDPAQGPAYVHDIDFPYRSMYRLNFSATLPGGHTKPVRAIFAFRRPH